MARAIGEVGDEGGEDGADEEVGDHAGLGGAVGEGRVEESDYSGGEVVDCVEGVAGADVDCDAGKTESVSGVWDQGGGHGAGRSSKEPRERGFEELVGIFCVGAKRDNKGREGTWERMEAEIAADLIQIFQSRKQRRIARLSSWPILATPKSLAMRVWMRLRSEGVRKRAVSGQPGMMKMQRSEITAVTEPSMMNILGRLVLISG